MEPKKYQWLTERRIQDTVEDDLSKNVSISMLCTFIQLATRFFIPPIVLSYVSLEEYGIWAYCFIFISYFGMSVVGITNVYVRYGAIYMAHRDLKSINYLLSTGLMVSSLICLVALGFFWKTLPYFFQLLQVPSQYFEMAFILIFGTIAIFSLELTLGMFNYLLHGLQRVGLQRIFLTAAHILESALIIVFLWLDWGIYALLYAFMFRIMLTIMLSAIACYRLIPSLKLRVGYFDRSVLKIFLAYGGMIQLRSAVGMINRSIEKVLAGMFLGAAATALYDLGEKFPLTVISIPKTANAVFLPANAHLHAKGRQDKIRSFYLSGSRFVSIITGFFLGFLACFSPYLMTAWLGADEKFQTAALILSCFALPYQIEVIGGPASAMFRSVNRPAIELWYGITELVLVLCTVSLVFFFISPSVLTINLCVGGMMIVASSLYLWYANRYLAIPQATFFRWAVLPGLVPYVAGLAFLIPVHYLFPIGQITRVQALTIFLAAGLLYALLLSALIFYIILSEEERQHLCDHYLLRAKTLFKKSPPQRESFRKDSVQKAEEVFRSSFENWP